MIYSNFELLSKLVNAQMLDPQHLKLVVQDLYYCNLARKYSCVMGYFHDYSKSHANYFNMLRIHACRQHYDYKDELYTRSP